MLKLERLIGFAMAEQVFDAIIDLLALQGLRLWIGWRFGGRDCLLAYWLWCGRGFGLAVIFYLGFGILLRRGR